MVVVVRVRGAGGSRPAAFMPVEQAGEELGPLERTADVRVAARLKASGLKCMCATDVRGDSLGSCFFPSCASVLQARLKPGRPAASGRCLMVCSGVSVCFLRKS